MAGSEVEIIGVSIRRGAQLIYTAPSGSAVKLLDDRFRPLIALVKDDEGDLLFVLLDGSVSYVEF